MKPLSLGGHLGRIDADSPAVGSLARSVMSGLNSGAKASTVNRTHRIVRERAQAMQANRSKLRSLFLPLALCSTLLVLLFAAVFMVVEQYELLSSETPMEGHHFLILLWFLPVSFGLVATVWFRRSRNQSDTEAIR